MKLKHKLKRRKVCLMWRKTAAWGKRQTSASSPWSFKRKWTITSKTISRPQSKTKSSKSRPMPSKPIRQITKTTTIKPFPNPNKNPYKNLTNSITKVKFQSVQFPNSNSRTMSLSRTNSLLLLKTDFSMSFASTSQNTKKYFTPFCTSSASAIWLCLKTTSTNKSKRSKRKNSVK